MPRCYASEVHDEFVELSSDEAHHVARVLRLRVGDAIVVFDGRGGEWDGALTSIDRGRVVVGALRPRIPLPEPPVTVTLAIGLLKGDQMHDVVRDATVLGAAAIVPFVSSHTARPAASRGEHERERWKRVAVAAAKQCGRAVVPTLEAPVPFADVLALEADLRVVCVEPARRGPPDGSARAMAPADLPRVAMAVLYVGPEGGWSPDELQRMSAAGVRWLSLGPRTLRAEAAPAVALTTLWTVWGWT